MKTLTSNSVICRGIVLCAMLLVAVCTVAGAEEWFGPPISSAIQWTPRNFAIGDLNGNGLDDVVYIASSPSRLVVLLNDGYGRLEQSWYEVGMGYCLALGDINGSGYLDIVTMRWSPTHVIVLYNEGDGSFKTSQGLPERAVGVVGVGDLDGNGWPDIVVPGTDRILIFWNGPGGINMTPDAFYVSWLGECGNWWPTQMVITDATGNGLNDVVFTAYNEPPCEFQRVQGVGLLENLGNRQFEFSWPIVNPIGGEWNSLAVADFDGDGLPDLSVSYPMRAFLRQPDGTYLEGTGIPGFTTISHTVGDVNEDGAVDLIRTGLSESRAYRGLGDGTFELLQAGMPLVKRPQLGQFYPTPGLDIVGFDGATFNVLPNILFDASEVAAPAVRSRDVVQVHPTVFSGGSCRILAPSGDGRGTEAVVTDVMGRQVAGIPCAPSGDGMVEGVWDGRDGAGVPVPAGWYWVNLAGERGAGAGRVLVIR